jgi:hypothetical protein
MYGPERCGFGPFGVMVVSQCALERLVPLLESGYSDFWEFQAELYSVC